MGMLVISGCYKSGWEKVLAVFPASSDFSSCFDKIFNASEVTDPVKLSGALTVSPNLQEEIAGLTTETANAPLIIADSRNTWLLDFWAERFPDSRFLLFYSNLGSGAANAFLAEIDPQSFLECWLSTNRQFLAFQRRYRQRTILLNAEAAVQHPQAMIDVLQQYGITFSMNSSPANPPADSPANPPADELPAEGLLAGKLLAECQEVHLLCSELEASAQPLGEAGPPVCPTPAALFSQYLQRKANGLQWKAMTQKQQDLTAAYKDAVQEKELLVLQLHQVQEELETTFLRKQQLDLACNQIEPMKQKITIESGEKQSKHEKAGFLKRLKNFLKVKKDRDKTKRKVLAAQMKRLRKSGLFDEQWYLRQYEDVARSGIDPVKHYLCHGVAEGRNPSPDFNTQCYLAANPEVIASGINPLLHYITCGKKEGRKMTKTINMGQ